MALPFHNRLAHSRVHREKCQPSYATWDRFAGHSPAVILVGNKSDLASAEQLKAELSDERATELARKEEMNGHLKVSMRTSPPGAAAADVFSHCARAVLNRGRSPSPPPSVAVPESVPEPVPEPETVLGSLQSQEWRKSVSLAIPADATADGAVHGLSAEADEAPTTAPAVPAPESAALQAASDDGKPAGQEVAATAVEVAAGSVAATPAGAAGVPEHEAAPAPDAKPSAGHAQSKQPQEPDAPKQSAVSSLPAKRLSAFSNPVSAANVSLLAARAKSKFTGVPEYVTRRKRLHTGLRLLELYSNPSTRWAMAAQRLAWGSALHPRLGDHSPVRRCLPFDMFESVTEQLPIVSPPTTGLRVCADGVAAVAARQPADMNLTLERSLLPFVAIGDFVKPIMPYVALLNVRYNRIGAPGLRALLFSIANSQTIKTLDIAGNNGDSSCCEALQCIFTCNKVLAVGETVLLLHPPSTFSGSFNSDGDGSVGKMTVSPMATRC